MTAKRTAIVRNIKFREFYLLAMTAKRAIYISTTGRSDTPKIKRSNLIVGDHTQIDE